MQKKATNSYFSFTKKERKGIVFLLLIISLLTTAPFFYSLIFKEKLIRAADIQNEFTILKTRSKDSTKKHYHKNFDENGNDNYAHYKEKKRYG